MKFYVNIEETINGIFEVEANSSKEAFDIAKTKYRSGEFINEPGNLSFVQASIMSNNGEFDIWEEF